MSVTKAASQTVGDSTAIRPFALSVPIAPVAKAPYVQ
jgi:hypothetical protein